MTLSGAAAIAHVKAQLLTQGIGFSPHVFDRCAPIKYNSFAYNHSSPKGMQARRKTSGGPQELILTNQKCASVVSCIEDPDSPYWLERDEAGLSIINRVVGETLPVKVILPPLPHYWSQKTASNTSMLRIVGTCALCQANVWLWHECAYVFTGQQCRFCGIGIQSGRKAEDGIDLRQWLTQNEPLDALWARSKVRVQQDVAETLQQARQSYYHDHLHLMFISGNFPNQLLDQQWHIYLDVMEMIEKSVRSLSELDAISLLMPPNDFRLIDRAFQIGLRKIAFNLEIWNEALFKRAMPGKAAYGRDKMIQALHHAVQVFGKGNVYTNLIIGIDADESLLSGAEQLASEGISVNPIVFHQDYGAAMSKHPRPALQSIVYVTRTIAQLYKQYELTPLYCPLGARTSLINEAYLGWLEGDEVEPTCPISHLKGNL